MIFDSHFIVLTLAFLDLSVPCEDDPHLRPEPVEHLNVSYLFLAWGNVAEPPSCIVFFRALPGAKCFALPVPVEPAERFVKLSVGQLVEVPWGMGLGVRRAFGIHPGGVFFNLARSGLHTIVCHSCSTVIAEATILGGNAHPRSNRVLGYMIPQ